MGTKTTILIKTDKGVKARAQKVAKDIGIPLGTLINAYLRQVGAQRRVGFACPPSLALRRRPHHFVLRRPPTPNAATRRAIANARAGKRLSAYQAADELFADALGDQWRGAL